MFQVGYAGLEVLTAFSTSASAKGMDIRSVNAEDLEKKEEYKKNIADFFNEIGININSYSPGWYILGYMD
jgi:hypothetical protein